MSQYSVLDDKDIATIVSEYTQEAVTSFKLLSGGSQNTNYLIQTSDDSYVLTICEEKSIEETINLTKILDHLAHHNFLSSVAIKTKDNHAVVIWKDKPVMLKSFIEGKVLDVLPPRLLKACGTQLAQLHNIPVPDYVPDNLCFGIDYFHEIEIYAAESDFYSWLLQVKQLITNNLSDDLPKALIHSDIFYNNVIVSHDESTATIMDFEDACHYYRIFDLSMMIVGLCSHNNTIDLEEVSNVITGYQSVSPLLPVEKERLQVFTIYAAAATAFWRHKQFNYTQVDDNKKDRYLEMKEIADNVRNIPSFSTLF